MPRQGVRRLFRRYMGSCGYAYPNISLMGVCVPLNMMTIHWHVSRRTQPYPCTVLFAIMVQDGDHFSRHTMVKTTRSDTFNTSRHTHLYLFFVLKLLFLKTKILFRDPALGILNFTASLKSSRPRLLRLVLNVRYGVSSNCRI
jgi:hypothetical protein